MTKKTLLKILNDTSSLGALPFYIFFCFFALLIGEKGLFNYLIIALLVSYIIVIFFKYFFFINRPKKEEYSNFLEKIDASSFPSHHTIRSTLILLFAGFYFNNIYMWILLIIYSLSIYLSRIILKKHSIIDIVGGIIIGILEFLFINLAYKI